MTDRELMQQSLDLLEDINQCSLPPTGIFLPAEIDHVMEALRARLAQPKPEPVAWRCKIGKDYVLSEGKPHIVYSDGNGGLRVDNGEPLYTAPPQREWVDLTNDEIDDIWAKFNDGYGIIEETLWGYERAIEAKLKEKNT